MTEEHARRRLAAILAADVVGYSRLMGEDDSLVEAAARGFRAVQFNFVISTNERAIRLWQRFGFKVVGTIPHAFDHPVLGLVDALVMHRSLRPPGSSSRLGRSIRFPLLS